MDWPKEKCVNFIEEYRKLDVLWNVRSDDYKNNQAKLVAHRKLATQFDCDVEMVKKKIKNLRTAFRREHKTLAKRKLGSSNKKNKWFAYDLLSFLLDVGISKRDCSSEIDAELLISDEEESENVSDADNLETSVTLNSSEVIEASQEIEKQNKNDHVETSYSENRGQKRKMRKIEGERTEETYGILKQSVKRDDCATYGEHVANEIRKLYPKTQTIVKHLINHTLFEAAMGKYDNACQSVRFDSSNSYPYCISSLFTAHYLSTPSNSNSRSVPSAVPSMPHSCAASSTSHHCDYVTSPPATPAVTFVNPGNQTVKETDELCVKTEGQSSNELHDLGHYLNLEN